MPAAGTQGCTQVRGCAWLGPRTSAWHSGGLADNSFEVFRLNLMKHWRKIKNPERKDSTSKQGRTMYLINYHQHAPERSEGGAAKACTGQRPLAFGSHQELEEFVWTQVLSWAWPEPATDPVRRAPQVQQLQLRHPRSCKSEQGNNSFPHPW